MHIVLIIITALVCVIWVFSFYLLSKIENIDLKVEQNKSEVLTKIYSLELDIQEVDNKRLEDKLTESSLQIDSPHEPD